MLNRRAQRRGFDGCAGQELRCKMIIQRLLFILILALVAGCATNSPAQLTPKPPPAGIPVATAVIDSVSQGELLFNQYIEAAGFSCVTCHYANSDDRLLGPGLLSLADRFKTYDIEVDSLESYIKQSIVDPLAFIVPDESPFAPNIMPVNYSDIFTDDELDALVDYILSFNK